MKNLEEITRKIIAENPGEKRSVLRDLVVAELTAQGAESINPITVSTEIKKQLEANGTEASAEAVVVHNTHTTIFS